METRYGKYDNNSYKIIFIKSNNIQQQKNRKNKYKNKDLPGHMTLKVRQDGQQSQRDLKYKDFKAELLQRESQYKEEQNRKNEDVEKIEFKEPKPIKKIKNNDEKKQQQLQQYGSSSSESEDEQIEEKNSQNQIINPFPQDADDVDFGQSSSDSEQQQQQQEDEEEDDSEDEDELLMKEYQKIKEQRELEEKQKQKQKEEQLEKERQQNLLKHNPLLDKSQEYSLKRKWFDETVFKNQARKLIDEKPRFINDNVRSDFHKKFLKKFINN
ncbi:hypothetical protein IMG5_138990 [Ichthyophthirius multifiliis]|uniref:Uncharacterized protein n=1 Tax=Ichthyophthirius multifiliis TaxID=5932 RepID=G0QX78_ICHMU|nr:hypothetical protein IMG5_138990 [Ichthyophthirius multifiliis]EGR30180.1 hypothetical protein IMG5_138990 [Ichthyophthirius multifiliis]|eukprot:XP_004031416.1 hypothetical protein IMG5_138990 [Ichthyophthirius multifiliis]